MDEVDRKLLDLLQQDAARSLSYLGDCVNLSPSAVHRRLARLRSSQAIARQVAVLSDDVLPGIVRACVLVSLERESAKLHSGFRERVRSVPEVQQCYDISGAWDYLVVLAAEGMPACRATIDRLFLDAPNVKRYETLFVMEIIKLGMAVPLAKRSRRAAK
ncbi:Lrp/AsnC family transcriptional regulator [Rudaea sp.]|uniref:Lrp/AsnC family transcriptional regulator n=1 Tax=Rudaea sp. TaxID=2136325 RepID=UPI002ED05772